MPLSKEQHRIYMQKYMAVKRASAGLKTVTENSVTDKTVDSVYYYQNKHYKRSRKVLREIINEVIYFDYVKGFDVVIAQLKELYPAYSNHRITKKGISF